MNIDTVLSKLQGWRRAGSQWKALCPAHDDKNPSLSIAEKDGRILLNCFSGCTTEAVLTALKMEANDLYVDAKRQKRKIVASYDYVDELGGLLYQKVRYEPKAFIQRRPRGRDGWVERLDGVRRVLYKLPSVLAATDAIITEGEKDADTGISIGFVTTTSGDAGSWKDEFSECLKGKRITVIADADDAGRKYARKVAFSLYGKVSSLKVLGLPFAKDLTEWCERGGTSDELTEIIRNTPEWTPQLLNGDLVLRRVFDFIRRFVSLSETQALVVSLWVAHTYTFDCVDATPYLAITSAEKECGKSRLLEVLEVLVLNPWMTGRVTAAVLTRKIDAEAPTLLLDESDAAFAGDKEYAEALRGLLNTGHRSSGKSSCCVGKGADISFKDFKTFCPKAIAGIGKLPDTVADRSIPIRLKRAAPGEVIARFRRRDVEPEAKGLLEQLESWCSSIAVGLPDARPELPDELTDRQQDGVEPLLALADSAGGDWPVAARRAVVELCSDGQVSDASIGVQLLRDIQAIFESKNAVRLSSADVTASLGEIETSPWCEWNHGKPITAARLARILKPFGITPQTIRIEERTPKGYDLEDFQDAFRRYLRDTDRSTPSSANLQSATTPHSKTGAVSSDSSIRNSERNVAARSLRDSGDARCGQFGIGIVQNENPIVFVRRDEILHPAVRERVDHFCGAAPRIIPPGSDLRCRRCDLAHINGLSCCVTIREVRDNSLTV